MELLEPAVPVDVRREALAGDLELGEAPVVLPVHRQHPEELPAARPERGNKAGELIVGIDGVDDRVELEPHLHLAGAGADQQQVFGTHGQLATVSTA